MDMCKAGRVRNDGIGDKGPFCRVARHVLRRTTQRRIPRVRLRWRPCSISRLDARPPAAHENLFDTPSSLAHLAALERVKARHEPRVLDHEGHELGGIAANVEELEPVLLDKRLKRGVGGDADAVAVGVAQRLAECDKGLDVAAGADNLDDNVEGRWRRLAGLAAKAGWDVSWGERLLGLGDGDLSVDDGGEELRETATFGANVDANTAVA